MPTKAERSARTRRAILDAARQQFGRRGFRGTTIRGVASEARVDPSLVVRHFGSKRELFIEATDIDLRLPDLTRVERDEIGRVLVDHMLGMWEDPDLSPPMRSLLITAATDDDANAEFVRVTRHQWQETIALVLPEGSDAGTVSGLITTQILGMAYCRFVLRIPSVVAIDRALIVDMLASNVQRLLVCDGSA